MKKTLISLVTLILTVVCACAFVGCGAKEEDPTVNLAKWSGTAGTLPDAVDNVIEIENGEQLAALAVAVNGANGFAGITVKLTADIDLDNKAWTPIGQVIYWPGPSFAGTFDGNGHVIYNMKTSVSGQVQGGINHSAAGLFGSLVGTVKNLTLKNVDVTSTHYAGAIVGYTSNNTTVQIINCVVDGGTITSIAENVTSGEYDNGDKVGGIIGLCTTSATVKNCTVKNITLKAYRDIGGIIGCADGQNTIENNTVGENVKIEIDNTHNYKNYTSNDNYNAGSIIGRIYNDSTYTNCTGTATIVYPNNN